MNLIIQFRWIRRELDGGKSLFCSSFSWWSLWCMRFFIKLWTINISSGSLNGGKYWSNLLMKISETMTTSHWPIVESDCLLDHPLFRFHLSSYIINNSHIIMKKLSNYLSTNYSRFNYRDKVRDRISFHTNVLTGVFTNPFIDSENQFL